MSNPAKVIFDTSVVIALIQEDQAIVQAVLPYEEVHVTTVVLGELYYGAYNSNKLEAHLQECQDVQEWFPMIVHDVSIAMAFGRIKAILLRKGRMIPENDLWIAAATIATDSTLITTDRHFERIEGLSLRIL